MSLKHNKQKTKEEPAAKGLTKRQRSWMYTSVFFAIVLILFVINNINGEPEQGPYPPNYKAASAETLKLSDLKGKIVILDFWATWCPPCRKGIPDLIQIKKDWGEKDVEIVGISVDAITRGGRTANDVIPFMKSYGINYPIIKGNSQVNQLYGGIRSIPTSFVIDKDGNVTSQHVGYVPMQVYLEDIEKILNGKAQVYGQAPDFELEVIIILFLIENSRNSALIEKIISGIFLFNFLLLLVRKDNENNSRSRYHKHFHLPR
jgi:cytochrome c biogenesis protein CcmG/thiol:disulfide interchange protein DsbE